MIRKRTFRKRLLYTLILLLIIMNIIAGFHAWKFTHFTPGLTTKTSSSIQYSFSQKLGILLTGVSNPRPQNKRLPNQPYQTIQLQSNKAIECWLLTAASPAKGTVLLCHGYSGEKSSMLDKAYILLKAGYNTMLVDFMGSGGSAGNQTTIGYKEAEQVKTCVDYLQQQNEQNIFLFGTSMGAVAIMKALKDYPYMPAKGAMLECPFGTMLTTVKNRFAKQHIPAFPMAHLLVLWGGLENGFNAYAHNPVSYAKHTTCPVLLMYGGSDDRVTPAEINSIFTNLHGPKKQLTFPLAGHENYLDDYRQEWTEGVLNFMSSNRN